MTRTRTVTKTEYRNLRGKHAVFVADQVVSASRGVHNDVLEAIEPFDMRALHRFDGKLIAGWVAEEASLSPQECQETARKEALAEVARQLGHFMPGDSHRGLTFRSFLSNEDLELLLLPIWTLPVRYDPEKPPVRLLVNGQTGKVTGAPPRSWVKITILILLAVGLLLGIVGAFVLIGMVNR